MAVRSGTQSWHPGNNYKRTSIGEGKIKTSSMNKRRKASFKKYRGQGK